MSRAVGAVLDAVVELVRGGVGRIGEVSALKIYLIGSLRNPEVPKIGNELRAEGYIIYDDWFAAGEFADDAWRDYERGRGHTLPEALKGLAAEHMFNFDLALIKEAQVGVLVLPAGRSGHIELGYMAGEGKGTFVLLEGDPDRYDLMYRLFTAVCKTKQELLNALREYANAYS